VTQINATAVPPSRRTRRRLILVGVLGVAALGALATFWIPLTRGNFGVVDRGVLYRSAQPGEGVDRMVRSLGLASILNLRGGSEDDPWYAGEVRAAQSQGVDFYDFPMNARRRPSRSELLTLLDLFARCRYPLLIHCKSGSDRTGLAVAMYLMSRRGEPPDRARRAFSLRHGHVPIGGPERLHEPLREYDDWLRAHAREHTPDVLRAWVEHDYRDDAPPAEVAPLRPGPRPRREHASVR
jgi:protein tyrosine phosphatase (PTP) superfamily phosphohydrolase (DUF442 family)